MQTPAGQQPVAQPVQRISRMGGIRLSNNFGDLQATLDEQIAAEKARNKNNETTRVYALDPSVTIDPTAFAAALNAYADMLQAQNRMNLASVLRNGRTELDHNCWRFTAESEILRNMVDREKDLLPYLRERLGVPELYGEFLIDSSKAQETHIPYTNEEKLREMARENPTLSKFQEIFKTRIIY
ncbi:MAG: hypothetical protein OHK0039_44700 [Bacteroidia bacterium]